VEEGLQPADTVVVNGLQHVMAGAKVAATRAAMTAGGSGLAQVAAADAPPGDKVLRTAAVSHLDRQ
jgi:hypothetical protein